jgi:two-component system, sensor histidine kinase YesM
MGYFSYSKLVEYTKESYKKDNMEILKSMDRSLQTYFKEFDRFTYNAFLSNDIQSILRSDNSNIKQRVKNQWLFNSFALNLVGQRDDVEGTYLICNDQSVFDKSSSGGIKLDYNIKSEPWYQDIEKGNGKFVIVSSHKQGYKMEPYYPYLLGASRVIKDLNNGRTIGTFIIEVKPNILQDLFQSNNKSDRKIIIIDNKDRIIYDNHQTNITMKFKDAYPGINVHTDKQGLKKGELAQFYTIALYSPQLDWTFLEIVQEERLLQQINSITFPIILIASLCFIIFFIVSFGISKNITNPIKLLEASMKEVEKGNFNQKALLYTNGEIGRLARRFNIMLDKIQSLIFEVYETRLKRADSEFKALQAQINPHFLYNSLESINCLAQIHEVNDISEMIRGLGNVFRYSMRQDDQYVILEEEISHVKNYVLLQAVRYDDKFRIEYDIPKELLKMRVIKFILQPLVENSISHGMQGISENGIIRIKARCKEDNLSISVSDNGLGIKKNRLREIKSYLYSSIDSLSQVDTENKSIGILNIHLRIRLCFGNKYGVHILSKQGAGTKVTVSIPLSGGRGR